MERERIAYMFMMPTILNAINRTPGIKQRRFPCLKCMLVSAAPISDETALTRSLETPCIRAMGSPRYYL
jgi:hypothetical protein